MIKYFCTEDQNVPLQQNVRPIAAGRTGQRKNLRDLLFRHKF